MDDGSAGIIIEMRGYGELHILAYVYLPRYHGSAHDTNIGRQYDGWREVWEGRRRMRGMDALFICESCGYEKGSE